MTVYTPKQRELMQLWQAGRLRRINLLEGSVSSGKTWISLVLWAFWVATMPESGLYLMTAKTLTTLRRNCLLLLQELVGEKNFTFSIPAKEGFLFGRRIILEGANDAKAEPKIRGVTLQGAYVDELTQTPEEFFAMLLSRLRLPGAKLIATTNPDRPTHWLMKNYIERAEELDFLDVRFLLEDNSFLPPEYVESIRREYTGVFYKRYILGEWAMAEGLIYPMHENALEAAETAENGDYDKWGLSIDYGTQNAFAALLWGRSGEVWHVVDEYYYSGRESGTQKTDEEYCGELDRFAAPVLERLPAGGKLLTVIDPSAASFIAALQKRRYKVMKADNAVADGIRETATAMQSGKIKISDGCRSLIREMQGYVWDEKAGGDVPLKLNDHACDAMRYFVKTMRISQKRREAEPFGAIRYWRT